MITFNDLMKGFGVVTVMNACIYKLAPGSSYRNTKGCDHSTSMVHALTPFDFECTHCYIDTLKIANLTQEGPTKTISGGQYSNPLLKYGKTMTLEMQNALGNVQVLQDFFGCDYDVDSGVLSVTDKFPPAFAIEGETFFVDQKTGEKKKVWIFIPQFIPDGILNLTQDAEGDAAVFDCNGTVGITRIKDDKHPDGHDIFYHIAEKPWLRFGYMISKNLDYVLDSETNTYSIVGLTDESYYGDVVIPAIHNGKRVTTINPNAFDKADYLNLTLTNVYIPSSVTIIEEGAFAGQDKLKRVVFGTNSNLRRIMNNAFSGTTSLTSFRIPDKVWYVHATSFGTFQLVDGYPTMQNASGVIQYTIQRNDWAASADHWLLALYPLANDYPGGEFPNDMDMPSDTIGVADGQNLDSDWASVPDSVLYCHAALGEDIMYVGLSEEVQATIIDLDGNTSTESITCHIWGPCFAGIQRYSYYSVDSIELTIPSNCRVMYREWCSKNELEGWSWNTLIINIPDTIVSFNNNFRGFGVGVIYNLPWTEEEAKLRGCPWSIPASHTPVFNYKTK